MTYLNMARPEMRGQRRSHTPTRVVAAAYTTSDIESLEAMVGQGRQKDLATFFGNWRNPPPRMGEWEIRVNVRNQDGDEISRTVVALPLTVRARGIFEAGCIAVLRKNGYTEDEAAWYYKSAWKKKYVWVDTVISATKEMIDAYQTVVPLENLEVNGDPRRLAAVLGIPKNPYVTSHAHFLVAVSMAKSIIKHRNRATTARALAN